jgi:hypothetical protein
VKNPKHQDRRKKMPNLANNLVYLFVLFFAVIFIGLGLLLLVKVLRGDKSAGEAILTVVLVLFGFAIIYWGYTDMTDDRLLVEIWDVWIREILTASIGG